MKAAIAFGISIVALRGSGIPAPHDVVEKFAEQLRAPTISDEAARYRLAPLDAAQIADTIGMDMTSAGNAGEFADRCHQLALQMRAFAGHTTYGSNFDDLSARSSRSRMRGTALMAFVRKVREW